MSDIFDKARREFEEETDKRNAEARSQEKAKELREANLANARLHLRDINAQIPELYSLIVRSGMPTPYIEGVWSGGCVILCGELL